jgi:hypothetical protein
MHKGFVYEQESTVQPKYNKENLTSFNSSPDKKNFKSIFSFTAFHFNGKRQFILKKKWSWKISPFSMSLNNDFDVLCSLPWKNCMLKLIKIMMWTFKITEGVLN